MFTPIKLDKTRNICIGFGAMRLYKGIAGKSMTKIDFEKEDVEDIIPTVIYCGLKHEDDSLTIEKVVELIDIHIGIKGATEVITEAFKAAGLMGEEKNV